MAVVTAVAAAACPLVAGSDAGEEVATADEGVFSRDDISTPGVGACIGREEVAAPVIGDEAFTEAAFGATALAVAERVERSPDERVSDADTVEATVEADLAEAAIGEVGPGGAETIEVMPGAAASILVSPAEACASVELLLAAWPASAFSVAGDPVAFSAVVTFSHHFPGIFTIVPPI